MRGRRASGGGRVLHLDTFSGIAGNMFLGALLDLGLARKTLEAGLSPLGLDYRLRVSKVHRGALAARYVDVRPGTKPSKGRRSAPHAAHSAHGRHYREIRDAIARAKLASAVKDRALAIFEALGRAEARVHGIALDRVHFHEVGAVDAIVDVVGAAVGLDALAVERVTATPVALGSGRVRTAHGVLPLPAPATLELLRGLPTVPAEIEWETVTPTGAAIYRCIVDEVRSLPAMTVDAIGHGAGDDREGPMPNVLRAVLGRSGGIGADRVLSLEANLDDLVPEHFDYLMERLFDAGALDVGIQHLQMKKNRPGFLVRVLARPGDRLALATILFSESTTAGVRTTEHERLVLDRRIERVDTPFGRIRVKRIARPDGRLDASPEYDDCRKAAARNGVPLREAVRSAERAAGED